MLTRFSQELEVARRAARAAAETILRHYSAGGIAVETKGDQSPVTQADKDANAVIVAALRAAFPEDGLISEELPDDLDRLFKSRVWIVDPLDGTRDFVARTGDFCVHVGLAVDGEAVLGVVMQPTTGALYTASAGDGAFLEDSSGGRQRLSVSSQVDPAALRMGVSRLNASNRLGQCLRANNLEANATVMGASVKHMAVARGDLEGVVNLSPGEQEWDTCAPEVIVREAGGLFTDGVGQPFRYNQRDLMHVAGSVASNGACHDALVAMLAPYLDPSLSLS